MTDLISKKEALKTLIFQRMKYEARLAPDRMFAHTQPGDKEILAALNEALGVIEKLNTITPEQLPKLEKIDFIDLGWVNKWKQTPGLVKACDHKKEVISKSNMGTETIYKCYECKYEYRVDSSG